MKLVLCLSLTLALVHCAEAPAPQEKARPNILLLVADDLGYTDLGVFGSEIRTPNLDALAREGLLLTRFYVAPNCSPTRAMLLSGTDAHPAGLGSMSGNHSENQQGQPGYEGYLSDRVVSVATLLQDAGYHTSIAGKWHLGVEDDQLPVRRGFSRSFTTLRGGASHFSDAAGLTRGTDGRAPYREDGEPVPELPEFFFSSEFYTEKIIEYIDEAGQLDQPFFVYAAYTAPHWPLQAPDDYIDRYRGVYDDGYDALRARRFENALEAGLVASNMERPPRTRFARAWDELSPEEQQWEAREMELYAAMCENLDFHIGRLIEHLKSIGQYENTLILFFPDNGPEGNPIEHLSDNEKWLPEAFDLSYENMGRVNSYVYYGAAWAQTAVPHLRDFKSFPTEGGVRVPAIARWSEVAAPGTRTDTFATIMDVAPTLLEAAGVTHPGTSYQGRTVEPLRGVSMLPRLRGESDTVHGEDHAIGWELFGRRGLKKGEWKILWMFEPYGLGRWELYNLATDPVESVDLSDQEPEKLEEMLAAWSEYARSSGVILPESDQGYAHPEVVDRSITGGGENDR